MSTILHMPAFNSAPHGPAFTSVNGRLSLSPPDEKKTAVAAKPAAWSPVSPDPEPQHHSRSPESDTSSSTVGSGDRSPDSSDKTRSSPENPNKRRRSGSEEDAYGQHSPDQKTAGPRQLPLPYQPLNRNTTLSMEAPPLPTLPPLGRPDAERRWQTEPRELPHAAHQHFQHREPHPIEHTRTNDMSPESQSLSRDMIEETEFTRAGVQVELKKRKRQFANRTKTGCGTCRRRKKKCDEAKPECNNCTRGGFVCEGYANKVPWPKNGPAKQPALIAKEKYAAYPTCPTCQEKHTPHCGQSHSTESSYPPPEMHSANGIDRKSWKPWGDPAPAPPSLRATYQPEVPPPPPPSVQYMQPAVNHYERPSSLDHRPVSQQQQQPHHSSRGYHHAPPSTTHLAINTAVPTTMAAKPIQQLHVGPHPPPPAPPTSLPPTRSPTRYASSSSSTTYRSEKDKMLAGEPFNPFDKVLMQERHWSAQAQFRFNTNVNPSNVLSSGTVDYFFTEILVAGRKSGEVRRIDSHMGKNCHVATPFACDYGYHLSLGENIVIGADCRFHDSARIAIGRNCKIGVRVTIQTLKTPTDTKSLKGSNGTEVAQEVLIGENVYIGDNCMIAAGVQIGPNTIVRPGSVVLSSFPANCVVQGNPATSVL
ncbi:maltose O-acetyltransferase [Alternaria rosae]|uniref:maltose O-acetyltransferase n=1 Tax=Alternaria rosae TaxID=1187941 RepID=UPI001E8D1B0F|nr:maltose O-acetyltransferase [Alternaria rosae]KAH6875339.1 maltose O-acetyltransferase [Alternaria rosae]